MLVLKGLFASPSSRHHLIRPKIPSFLPHRIPFSQVSFLAVVPSICHPSFSYTSSTPPFECPIPALPGQVLSVCFLHSYWTLSTPFNPISLCILSIVHAADPSLRFLATPISVSPSCQPTSACKAVGAGSLITISPCLPNLFYKIPTISCSRAWQSTMKTSS